MAESNPRRPRVMRIMTAEEAERGARRVQGETRMQQRRERREREHARLGDALSRPARTVTPPAAAAPPEGPAAKRAAAWAGIDETVRSMPPPPATQPTRNPELERMMDPANFTTGAEGDEPRSTPGAEPVPPIAEGDEEEAPEDQATILPKGGIPIQMQQPKLSAWQKVGKGIGFAQQHYPFPGAANGVFVLGFGLAAVAIWTPVIRPILQTGFHATPENIKAGYIVPQFGQLSTGAISLVLFLLLLSWLATLSPDLAEVIFWLVLGLWAVFLVMNPDVVQSVASWVSQGNASLATAKTPAPPVPAHGHAPPDSRPPAV